MFRITALSLLLGAAVLILGITQIFPASDSYQQQAPPLLWNATAASTTSGTSTIIDNGLQIVLDGKGAGAVTLANGKISAEDFSFIHLALERPATDLEVTIVWTNDQEPREFFSYTIESQRHQSLWLATEEIRGWSGEIITLSLHFAGQPGDVILIEDFSAFPASAGRQLLAIYSDLTGYKPWNSAAMNTYSGAFNSSSFYPIVLAVAYLALCLLAYGVVLLVFRGRLRFNPAVAALIFLANWLILDILWQYKLLHQLADTRGQFSGMNTEEKLAVGPDAELYALAINAIPLLEAADSRIFVTSGDNYSGMRLAYYFYPLNVHWALYGPPLPLQKFLRKGDYIVVANPSVLTFDPVRELLVAPRRKNLNAELVFADDAGTVVRLK